MDSKGLQELTDIYLKEISADTALRASKEADKARGKAAAGGDKEKAKAKAAQASRLYKASAEKRKKEPVATPDRSYPKGKGASYREEVAALRGLVEKKKESYKTVAAVIDYDRSKKGTDDAVYDTEHGEDEKAKKERDYAAWEREKMKKDDPNWKHKKYHTGMHGEEVDRLGKFEDYDELDNDLLEFAENTLCNFPEDEILDMMESMWHRRNPGKKHPLESGSSKVKRRPVSDAEKKSTDKEDRMYVAMRRVKDRQKGYSKDKSDAADRLHSTYTDRQSKRKAGASSKEAAAQSHGEFGGKGFNIKRGGRGRKGSHAPETDRGKGSKAKKRAAALTKEENFFSRFRNI